LYLPESYPQIDATALSRLRGVWQGQGYAALAFEVLSLYIDDIPRDDLQALCKKTYTSEVFGTKEIVPLKPLQAAGQARPDLYLEALSNGPTLAFKDMAMQLLGNLFEYELARRGETLNILGATSGDTGGAVASGFLGVAGVEVVILYPSGKVSDIQERQLTTLGQNITALEVDGFFDDCQDMVKKAFLDEDLKHKNLTSANSINIARWLPQMFYFFFAYKALKKQNKPLVVACPSGNFGNICAGIMAKKLGLPIAHFVAATNVNDTVPRFLENGKYDPKPSIATISNAMDVGNPSNFIRIQELYGNDLKAFEKDFSAFAFTDEVTQAAMKSIYKNNQYIAEPHGAVGYLGLKKVLENSENSIGVFLETAHPIKFLDIVIPVLNIQLKVPKQIESVLNKEKMSIKISSYEELKTFLNNQN
jgi:threonine synthase